MESWVCRMEHHQIKTVLLCLAVDPSWLRCRYTVLRPHFVISRESRGGLGAVDGGGSSFSARLFLPVNCPLRVVEGFVRSSEVAGFGFMTIMIKAIIGQLLLPVNRPLAGLGGLASAPALSVQAHTDSLHCSPSTSFNRPGSSMIVCTRRLHNFTFSLTPSPSPSCPVRGCA